MKKVELYTDGACSGNPGIGGWGAILKFGENERELSGYGCDSFGNPIITTNNVMELLAVVRGLQALKEPCEVIVTSDSKYVTDAFNQKWIDKWQMNGWRGDRNKEVKNEELWKVLLSEKLKHSVTFVHVRGHEDNEFNNRCDKLAVSETKKAKQVVASQGKRYEKGPDGKFAII